MVNVQSYIRPTLVCAIFMLVAIFYQPLWDVLALMGLVSLSFTYWAMMRNSGNNKVLITMLASQVLSLVLIASALICAALGFHFMTEPLLFLVFIWTLIVLVAIHIVAKIIVGFITYQAHHEHAIGIAMIVSVFLLAIFFAFYIVRIVPESVEVWLPRLLCLSYAVESVCVFISFMRKSKE